MYPYLSNVIPLRPRVSVDLYTPGDISTKLRLYVLSNLELALMLITSAPLATDHAIASSTNVKSKKPLSYAVLAINKSASYATPVVPSPSKLAAAVPATCVPCEYLFLSCIVSKPALHIPVKHFVPFILSANSE